MTRRILILSFMVLLVPLCACKQNPFSQGMAYLFMSPLSPEYFQAEPEIRHVNRMAMIDTSEVDGLPSDGVSSKVQANRWIQPASATNPSMNSSRIAYADAPKVNVTAQTEMVVTPPTEMIETYFFPYPNPQEQFLVQAQPPKPRSRPVFQIEYPPPSTLSVAMNQYSQPMPPPDFQVEYPQPIAAWVSENQYENQYSQPTATLDFQAPYAPEIPTVIPSAFQEEKPLITEPLDELPIHDFNKTTFAGGRKILYLGAAPNAASTERRNTAPQQRPVFSLAQFEEPFAAAPRPLGQLSMQKEDLTDRLQVDPNLAHRAVSQPQRQSLPRMESLIDGGDRLPGAHVRGDLTLSGVNPEDTMVVYENGTGRHSVQPSNQVQVYSPRFGSVRVVEGLTINEQKELATAANSTTKFSTQRRAVPTGRTEQEVAASYARSRTQLESTRGRFQGGEMAGVNSVSETKSTDLVTSFSTLLMHEKIEAKERVHLAQGKTNAICWSGAQGLLVRVNELALREMHGIDRAAAVFQVDDGQTVHEIRLIKVADKDTASPGEIVEFTLRFENTGSETLQNITVLDSLTGRLEFLPDSAKSSVPAAFYVEPNEAGSMVLRWELSQPLKPREFGVVVFLCRVR